MPFIIPYRFINNSNLFEGGTQIFNHKEHKDDRSISTEGNEGNKGESGFRSLRLLTIYRNLPLLKNNPDNGQCREGLLDIDPLFGIKAV